MVRKSLINRRCRWNRDAALEGLPLYLIILVVVAAVAIVAILSFFPSGGKNLDAIEVNDSADFSGDAIILDTEKVFYVKALDNDGKPLEGVTVTASGPNGAIGSGTTNGTGIAQITLSDYPTLSSNVDFGEISVTAKYTGSIAVTKTCTVTVQNA